MAEFKTLQFENTPKGQIEKTQALARETAVGWKVISETVTSGEFSKEKACCFASVCLPCVFFAAKKGFITVTLQKG